MKRKAAKYPSVTLEGLKRHGIALYYVPEAMKTEAVCLAAVKAGVNHSGNNKVFQGILTVFYNQVNGAAGMILVI